MRLIFMGTPDIARECLQRIVEKGHSIIGVYTKPDTPKNRGMKLSMSPVKEYAISQNIPVYQPRDFRDAFTVEQFKTLRPDLVVVVAFGKILPSSILNIPPMGCINMHASILPELRGAAPVQWSILNHMSVTGVTAMYMSPGMDEGDIIDVCTTPIDPKETSAELMCRLADLAADLACRTIDSISNGCVARTPQDPAKASYAPMLKKSMAPIDWTQPLTYVIDHVRGMIPWPVATAQIGNKTLKVYCVEDGNMSTSAEPGSLLSVTPKGLLVSCGDGKVAVITQVQADGGRRMSAADYFRGHPIDKE